MRPRRWGAWSRSSAGPNLLEDPLLVLDRQVAAVPVAEIFLEELRHLFVAGIEAVRTARVERAALRHIDQRGWTSLDRVEPLDLAVDVADRLHQPPRVGMPGLVVDAVPVPRLHD